MKTEGRTASNGQTAKRPLAHRSWLLEIQEPIPASTGPRFANSIGWQTQTSPPSSARNRCRGLNGADQARCQRHRQDCAGGVGQRTRLSRLITHVRGTLCLFRTTEMSGGLWREGVAER